MRSIHRKLIALALVVLLPLALMLWTRWHQPGGFASLELIAYPLIFGSLGIALIVSVQQFLLRQPLCEFNAAEGSWGKDLLLGAGLAAIYFFLFWLFQATLSGALSRTPNLELLNLMLDMRSSPLLVLIWFGPVLWIGIALFEELLRAFMLNSLWSFSKRKTWILISIVLAAAVVGLAHVSQGPYGMVTIGLKSVVTGLFYYRYRRLLPLIFAHVLYDGIQVGMFMLTYPS